MTVESTKVANEMNIINIPGFTAEASMYTTRNAYQVAYGTLADSALAGVMPQ
jgi:hypothetical protein